MGNQSQNEVETTNKDATTPPASKKTKMARLFSFMEDTAIADTNSANIDEEFQAYINHSIPLDSKTPLRFWKETEAMFPKLA